MRLIKCIRPKDTVFVMIFKHKITGKYSYVNLTKRHICPYQFDTIEEAYQGLEEEVKKGKVIKYEEYDIKHINVAERDNDMKYHTIYM